jgi:uncharacterized coiled-coil protein SlyX
MTEELLPEFAPQHIGEFYVCKAEGTVWYVAANAAMVSLSDLLANAKPIAPPRVGLQGEPGKDAAPGRDGKHGRDGVDGTPGGAGASIVGPAGRDGRDGKDCVCKNVDADNRLSNIETRFANLQAVITHVSGKSDAASAATLALLEVRTATAQRTIAELNAKQSNFATARSVEETRFDVTALRAECARLAATVQALTDYNKHAGEYIEWLRERAAQRSKK